MKHHLLRTGSTCVRTRKSERLFSQEVKPSMHLSIKKNIKKGGGGGQIEQITSPLLKIILHTWSTYIKLHTRIRFNDLGNLKTADQNQVSTDLGTLRATD